jgi:hypothetical protein
MPNYFAELGTGADCFFVTDLAGLLATTLWAVRTAAQRFFVAAMDPLPCSPC